MTRVARWRRGDATLWKGVDQWLAGDPAARDIADNERRRVALLRTDAGLEVIVKRFLPRRGLQRLIAAGRRRLAQSSARREWRALARLRSVGSSVPEPLALAQLQDGGEVLVLSYVRGVPLQQALGGEARERRRLLAALGEQVALLHAAGLAHGDLHAGNILVDENAQPVLLDFQRARRVWMRRARIADLGALDFSLSEAEVSSADRMRFRAAALGVLERANRAQRRALRRVGVAATRHARRHFRSRTRRCLRPGRLYARIHFEGRTGLRLRRIPNEVIAEALAIHDAVQSGEGELRARGSILKRDHRSRVTAAEIDGHALIVKEVVKRGRARLLADALRGSPARRAWLGGHGLRARGIRSATPLAFVERRRLRVPVASAVVLEDLRPSRPANEVEAVTPREQNALAEALRRLAVALHRRGIVHGDFQAPHIYLREHRERLEGVLIDLEGVRFRRRLSDNQRIQSFAELNASIPDAILSAGERRRAFERYAQVLPFGEGESAQSERLAAESEIVRRSLDRGHLWKGEGCRPEE